MSWPCRTPRCANPAESGRRKLCADCLRKASGGKKKPKKCRVRGCPRPQLRDGLCAVCHPDGQNQAQDIVVKAVAEGVSPARALREQGKSPQLAIEMLMRADTQDKLARLITSAGFQPAQGLRTLARLLDAKALPHPKLAVLAQELGRKAEDFMVDDNATQLEAFKLWREVFGVAPAAEGGGAGSKTVIAVHVGQVPQASQVPDGVRGAYLPPLKPINDAEVVDVAERDDDNADD